jgi:hypothetical protein
MISTEIFVSILYKKNKKINRGHCLMVYKKYFPLDFNYLHFHYYENVQLIKYLVTRVKFYRTQPEMSCYLTIDL